MITKLSLFDFRNYPERHFDFEKKVVFFGKNGKGKTNILEAISILSVGKSWREKTAADLILEGKKSALIQASTESKNIFKVQIQPRSRSFEKNEKKLPFKKYFGYLPSLLFAPEHLELFSGTKTNRQKYFDRFLAQISPNFRDNLMRANRARKQKNTILKSSPHSVFSSPLMKGRYYGKDMKEGVENDSNKTIEAQISPWNQILAETIPLIWDERIKLLKELNPLLQEESEKISGSTDSLKMSLETSENFDPTTTGILKFFKENKERELAAKKTLLGPHRDDFVFSLREKPLLSSASRGEIRSILLALLSAKKKYLQQKLNQFPILLLDDVFSELDDKRQECLEQICEDSQVFFTTTHEEHFQNFSEEVQKLEIK